MAGFDTITALYTATSLKIKISTVSWLTPKPTKVLDVSSNNIQQRRFHILFTPSRINIVWTYLFSTDSGSHKSSFTWYTFSPNNFKIKVWHFIAWTSTESELCTYPEVSSIKFLSVRYDLSISAVAFLQELESYFSLHTALCIPY